MLMVADIIDIDDNDGILDTVEGITIVMGLEFADSLTLMLIMMEYLTMLKDNQQNFIAPTGIDAI
jgi:hypothetical protein